MTEWTQTMHGDFQSHVATWKCCSLFVVGGLDAWLWIVRCSRGGGSVEAEARTIDAAKAAAEEIARRLAVIAP